MATHTTSTAVKDGEAPVFYVTEEPHHEGESTVIGFWMFLMQDMLLFCGFFAIFAWLGGHYANGPAPLDDGHGGKLFHLGPVAVNTVIMLTSAFTVSLALMETRKENVAAALKWIGVTTLLGVAFLFMQYHEYGAMAAVGATWETSAFLSSFWSIVLLHCLHVVAGIVWAGVLALQLNKHGLDDANERRVVCFGMFWNFLDITWVCVFVVVYLMGVLK